MTLLILNRGDNANTERASGYDVQKITGSY